MSTRARVTANRTTRHDRRQCVAGPGRPGRGLSADHRAAGRRQVRRHPLQRKQSSVRGTDFLRRRRRSLHGIRRHRHRKYVKYASIATAIGFTANTLAVAHRWYLAGRPPFASIYEMLLSFVWTLAALTLVTEKKFGVKIIGSITMPLAVVCVILMQLLPSEVRPLVPALQSTWLHVHVTLAMLSYAACAVSFALAMMFLIKDHFPHRHVSGLDERDWSAQSTLQSSPRASRSGAAFR